MQPAYRAAGNRTRRGGLQVDRALLMIISAALVLAGVIGLIFGG